MKAHCICCPCGVHCVFRRRTRNSTKNIRAFARVAVTRVLVFLVL
uniref:Uncharacterized protein n=1 Tax=Anopheles arabiensis TaxID=7173 RepID=A0A182IFS7_ANOAR